MKKLLALAVAAMLFAPLGSIFGIALFIVPATASQAACIASNILLGPIPDSLQVTTRAGVTFTLNRQQLTRAGTIIQTGAGIPGVGRDGILIALMAALTESTLRQLANTSAYPESAGYDNDGDGSDHDSLGLFQMRPQSGWGTVAELMDPVYQARAFFGGPDGPNYPSPRGLLDIPGWQNMDKGEAAQSVEVSAYPDRYQNYEPVARTILDALTARPSGGNGTVPADESLPVATRIVIPVPAGSYFISSPFGMREDPLKPGLWRMHWGTDFAAADGTPILAIADGIVLWAGYKEGWNNILVIEHNIAGERVASVYVHMWDHGYHVTAGQRVTAGQHIADVGSEGYSTGPHLHFEIRPGGWGHEAVDAEIWLAAHGAEGLDGATTGGPGCRL